METTRRLMRQTMIYTIKSSVLWCLKKKMMMMLRIPSMSASHGIILWKEVGCPSQDNR